CASNHRATTQIYTLSLHDALPISWTFPAVFLSAPVVSIAGDCARNEISAIGVSGGTVSTTQAPSLWLVRGLADTNTDYSAMLFRSEEHTSELQSRENLVCRLLLEK